MPTACSTELRIYPLYMFKQRKNILPNLVAKFLICKPVNEKAFLTHAMIFKMQMINIQYQAHAMHCKINQYVLNNEIQAMMSIHWSISNQTFHVPGYSDCLRCDISLMPYFCSWTQVLTFCTTSSLSLCRRSPLDRDSSRAFLRDWISSPEQW